MNPVIKELWLIALRSGDYTQGIHALREGEGSYCCLGVLCDIHSKEKGISWRKNEVGSYVYIKDMSVLPTDVMEWAGLKEHNPAIAGTWLAVLNDDGRDFKYLSDLIEKEL